MMTVKFKLPSQKKMRRKNKVMPGKMVENEPLSESLKEYRIKVHNIIMDTVA